MYSVENSKYIENYKDRMCDSVKLIHPEWDESYVRKVLDNMIQKRVQNPVVEMDNNYTGEHKEASLISVFDWALKAKPIIAGNGTFYKNQYQAINPVAKMLDNMLITRKKIKKQMFELEDEDSDEYADLDRG